eukprot:680622-Rhodomonas_salina.1
MRMMQCAHDTDVLPPPPPHPPSPPPLPLRAQSSCPLFDSAALTAVEAELSHMKVPLRLTTSLLSLSLSLPLIRTHRALPWRRDPARSW